MTTQNEEMVFDPGMVEQIDQTSVENNGSAYPTIQWHTGNSQLDALGADMRYMGGFFLPADLLDEALLLAGGWKPAAYKHNDGSQTAGFWRREMAVAVIAMRKRWEVFTEGVRTPQLFAWSDFEHAKAAGRPSSRTHVLCLIKGLEAQGPLVLTFKGTAGMAFEGVNTAGVLTEFSQTIIARANRESDAAARAANRPGGKRWPFRCFWLPVGAARDAGGNPIFVEVGKGNSSKHVVLPQALGLPARPEDVVLSRFYVGADLLALGNQLYAEAEANWTHAWDKLDVLAQSQPAGAVAAIGGLGAGYSAPAAAPPLTPPAPNVLEALGL